MPSWVQAEETKPAPMPLLLVQAFVNTFEADQSTDQLSDTHSAQHWLSQAGLIDKRTVIDDKELAKARSVREAIRALLEANAGEGRPSHQQIELLNKLAGTGVLRVAIGDDGRIELGEAGTGFDQVVARLLLIIRDAQRDGKWYRMKACSNSECRWAYYDRSHSNRGRWCDMAVCGNRVKNRNLRARRR